MMDFTNEYLSESTRSAIHDLALKGRELLTKEARDLLEGVYGLHADGSLEDPEHLPTMEDEETHEIYKRLIQFLKDEETSGLPRVEAVEKLVKEIAFTHLNRLVAFKMMEERKLIHEAIQRGHQSNGFKYYLADHPEELDLFEQGKTDRAYQHFILWQSSQVAKEIAVLFDPDTLTSLLFPRPTVLAEFLDLLNDETLKPAWQVEETIGWVYQFFNEKEKQEVFNRLYKEKQKVRREDIPAATQLFTPHWIVKFLIQNTLGRLWVQMHPDSRLINKLDYLVPLAGDIPLAEIKPVKEISLLDPACGTMHFGLVAFDLFEEMYLEELTKSGTEGWPESPSVLTKDEIPVSIIKNNIFGIDIDLRATQLSALTLYLRAKKKNQQAEISDHNLACADVMPFSTKDLARFIVEMKFANPIFEQMLRGIREQLEDISHLGSLIRIEKEIHNIVEEERKKHLRYQQKQMIESSQSIVLPGMEDNLTETEYYEILEGQLIQSLDFFRKSASKDGNELRFFVREAAKSLRILDLMLRRYDCVVANPPYMSRRNMNEVLADFLKKSYPSAKGDLYAAFITRCAELCSDSGRVGMITQQSFMFISSYEKMRTSLLEEFAIETMAHTGPRAFSEISGEKVNTTAFVLRREPDTGKRNESEGIYFRLVHEPDAETKRIAFEKVLTELKGDSD
jgi:hypothetical protein